MYERTYVYTYIDVERCWKRLIPVLFVAAVMYFIIIIVWIVAIVAATQGKFDTCTIIN